MEYLIALGVVVFIAVAIMSIKLIISSGSGPRSLANRHLSLERKLEILAECGLKLADPFTVEELLKSFSREEYEEPGFDLTLIGLGMTEEKPPWRNHCVNLWYFDTECIEDHGDYKVIAERMVEMSQGSLTLEDIEDYVDVENKTAWLSFTFQGEKIKIDCKVEDDWVDTSVLARIAKLLKHVDSSKVYFHHEPDVQDCVVGCVKKADLEKLLRMGAVFLFPAESG